MNFYYFKVPKLMLDIYVDVLEMYLKSDDSAVFMVQRGKYVVRIGADVGCKVSKN